MKKKVVVSVLLMTLAGQAIGMGHPHNLFTTRRALLAKRQAVLVRSSPERVTQTLRCPLGPAKSQSVVSATLGRLAGFLLAK